MELILPAREYEASYREAIREYRTHGVTSYAFLEMTEPDVFAAFENYRLGRNLPWNYVGATYFWLVDGGGFIGEISLRHRLTEGLTRFGGHIGYGVRHSRWGQGFGTAMLSLALGYARDVLGFERVLITCNDNNPGSARMIEKNGGVLQDKIINNIDGKALLTRRYWIAL